MIAALLVLVLLQEDDAVKPDSRAFLSTLRTGLSDSVVVVQEEREVSESLGERAGEKLHASSVICVHFSEPDRSTVLVEVLRTRDHHWTRQWLHFEASDVADERGRSMGLVLLSDLAESGAETTPSSSSHAPTVTALAPPKLPEFAQWGGHVWVAGEANASSVSAGAEVSAYWQPWSALRMQVQMQWLEGTVSGFAGGLRILRPGVQASYTLAHGSSWQVGLGLGMSVENQHYYRSEDAEISGGRWLAGLSVRLEEDWRLSQTFRLASHATWVSRFGNTSVAVNGVTVGYEPWWAISVGLGIRWSL